MEPDHADESISRRGVLQRGAAGAAVLLAPTAALARPARPVATGTLSAAGTTLRAPKRGGRLRVADPGGGTTETLDPQKSLNLIDEARDRQLYDTLTFFKPDYTLQPYLATSLEPNADASRWQIKLRAGVTFHNGKTLTADDVLYTWRRILDPKTASGGSAAIANVDLQRTKKVSDREILVVLKRPQIDLPILLTGREQSIIPNGFTNFAHPIGTGPFQYVSFTPGQQSLFKRNPHYWQDGQPYVDELQMTSIPDSTARLNALLGGEVDAIDNLPFINARTEARDSRVKVIVTKTPTCLPFVMQTDAKAFRDRRVREALALAIDRQKTVDVALLGYGQIGNDLFGKGTPFYDSAVPQRQYDPQKAKALLKQAGATGLQLTLHTNPATVGNVESCQAFQQHAKAAGINITVKVWDAAKFGSDIYNRVPFFQTYWNFPPQIMLPFAFSPTAPYNETHFNNASFASLYAKAEATIDPAKRKAVYDDLQQLLWQQVPYIIWGFFDFTDATSSQVQGLIPHAYFNLGAFQFRTWWLA